MVVDTSALLAIYFAEPTAVWVVERLEEHAGELVMSTVNAAEVLILLRDRGIGNLGVVEERFLSSGLRFVSPDMAQARIAAEARGRFPLNLGDCFAYALSVVEECPILTLDEDFRGCDRPVVIPEG